MRKKVKVRFTMEGKRKMRGLGYGAYRTNEENRARSVNM